MLWALASQSCNTKKYLKPGENLLVKNQITIISDQPNAEKNALRYELQTALRQVPNDRSFLFFKPRLWFYYRQEERGDTTDFGKFVQRKLAEPPSLYDPALSDQTLDDMREIVLNKGYLEPDLWYQDTIIGQYVRVRYFVKPNRQYRIKSFDLLAPDPEVGVVLEEKRHASFMQEGQPVSRALLGQEKQRIIDDLHAEGYADFTFGNFSTLEATDTTDGLVDMRLRVLSGQGGKLERKYIGDVTVINRFESIFAGQGDSQFLDSIRFVNFDVENRVRPSTLLKYIYLRPGETFKKNDLALTRAQLQLPAIQFADIRYQPRADEPNIVDFSIELLPAKRLETDLEFEVNMTTVSSESFIGLGSNLNLVDNNLFGGSERFSTGLDISFELRPKIADLFNAANVNFYNSLEIPRFADYFGLYRLLRGTNLLSPAKYGRLRSSANSVLDVGYEYVDLFRFFNYHSISAQYGFRTQINGVTSRKRIQITHPSLTYFDPTIRVEFDSLYSEQTFARKSFGPQLFTSLFFNGINYSVERLQGARGFSSTLIAAFELSGGEAYLANLIANGLDRPFRIGSLTFAQFAKLDLDGRLYKQLSRDQVLALRASVGLAVPFGTSDVIPYVKQFYLGGPLSMRAWRIRELGPGGYEDTTVTRASGNPFFQAGDVKILLNAEYRFDVFWRIEGAVFLDAGNIWSLKKDERTGGLFTSRFLQQMAVGSGAGMRFDADYFKVVLDVGLKLRNPFPDESGRHRALRSGIPARELINWNFAINYPF